MKREAEQTMSFDEAQEYGLQEIRRIENILTTQKISNKEFEVLMADMLYKTRKFLMPFDCQNP